MRELILEKELSLPQYEAYQSTAKNTCVVAGVGSGKTDLDIFRQFSTMFSYPGINTGYFAPTVSLIRDIYYPKATEFLEKHKIRHRILEQKGIIKIPGYGQVICRTMMAPESIVGFEIGDAFIDEFDQLKEKKALKAFRNIKARCRQKVELNKYQKKFWKKAGYKAKHKPNQAFVSTTPEGFGPTYKLFKNKPKPGEKSVYIPNSKLVQMSTFSNLKNLQDDYIDSLLEIYPKQLINAYLLGIFVNLVSLPVWTEYDKDKNQSNETIQGSEDLHVGIDFNVNRGCAIVHVLRDKEIHAVDEIVNTYDTRGTIAIINDRYPNNKIIAYPDATGKSRKSSASQSDLSLLRNEGYLVRAYSKNPFVKDRVNATNAMFCNGKGERRYFVNSHKCPYYSDGLLQQVYDNNGQPEKGQGRMDDITDAGSYPIAFLFPIEKPNSQQLIIGGY